MDCSQARREAILAKTSERLARYEAWKASGKGKGGVQGPFGFGSRTPRDICERLERSRRSASQSAIYRRSPNDSDSDSYIRPQRRAISACSTVRRHCCVDVGSSSGKVSSTNTPLTPPHHTTQHAPHNMHHIHSTRAGSLDFYMSYGKALIVNTEERTVANNKFDAIITRTLYTGHITGLASCFGLSAQICNWDVNGRDCTLHSSDAFGEYGTL